MVIDTLADIWDKSIGALDERWDESIRRKERDEKDFFDPLGDFSYALWVICYLYTPTGYFLDSNGIYNYATRIFRRKARIPFFGKNPAQMRTHVVNLIGADLDPETETSRDDYNAALEILLHHILNCPKYTVIPDYSSSSHNKSNIIDKTEKWFRDVAEVTGASSAVNSLFKGVPLDDIIFGYIPMRSFFYDARWQPEWGDDETLRKFHEGMRALQDRGETWDGTNIDF